MCVVYCGLVVLTALCCCERQKEVRSQFLKRMEDDAAGRQEARLCSVGR